VHTVAPPFARAIPSHAFFAIIEAENWSEPLPMPDTIWLLQTFAKPHTRTHPVALQNHFVPAGFVPPPLDPPDDADDDVDDPAKGFVDGSGVGSLSSSGVGAGVGAPLEVDEEDEEDEGDVGAGSGSAATAATRTNMPTTAITPSAPSPPTMSSTIVRVDIPDGGGRGGGGW